jgi:adenine-specific DNA-methyltransferase
MTIPTKTDKKKNKNISNNVEILGQVFTPDSIVDSMIDMRKNHGSILEPSCGNGAFSNKIQDIVALELDNSVAPDYAQIIDFFDYSLDNKFDTIIGNPPYVKYKDILSSTKEKLDLTFFDKRTNLYIFFMEKCIRHLNLGGEIIFIVPRDFIKATSCLKFNKWLYDLGTITHSIDTGDDPIFGKYNINCLIFRFEKDLFDRNMPDGRIFECINGQLLFSKKSTDDSLVRLGDYFDVKVGAVSGADDIFEHDTGSEFVCSTTRIDAKTKKMIYNVDSPVLGEHKSKLLARKIKKFTEDNWWEWGRKCPINDYPRLYVNGKTRNQNPFFTHSCTLFDGAILAIFPKNKECDVELLVDKFNGIDWVSMGFSSGGRFLFSQKSLENSLIPKSVVIDNVSN